MLRHTFKVRALNVDGVGVRPLHAAWRLEDKRADRKTQCQWSEAGCAPCSCSTSENAGPFARRYADARSHRTPPVKNTLSNFQLPC